MISFISDLDNTLIYSKIKTKGVCVEKIDDRELSFMTPKAYEVLEKLLIQKDFHLIPCTARSFEQTMRISFLQQHQPDYMICDLGASIYHNGVKDENWEDYLLTKGILYPEKMRKIRGKIDRFTDLSTCRKFVSNSDYFFVYCFYNTEDAKKFYVQVESENDFKESEVSFYVSGRKVYCYPRHLDKSLAVGYLQDKIQPDKTITSGDSLFDFKFNQLGDLTILPGHAEFLLNGFCSKSCGIEAGEDILSVLAKVAG